MTIETAGVIPGLEMLSDEERRALLTKAENLWRALEGNNLGGYSSQNRPFYIFEAFREVIEDFGQRNTGYRNTGLEIAAHLNARKEGDQ
jgi:hypothetical protein